MTLSTHIIILDPTPPRPVFDLGVSLLAKDPVVDWEPLVDDAWGDDPGWVTKIGQGLAAIYMVTHAVDGPLRYYEPADVEWMSGPIPDWNEHAVRIFMDTAYGYRQPNGARSEDLHVWLAGEIANHLDDLGVRYLWWLDTWGSEDAQTTPHAPPEWGDPELGRLG